MRRLHRHTLIVEAQMFDWPTNRQYRRLRRVDILKTGKAHTPSGGIVSTVNIQTVRPLDMPGFNATAGAKFIRDDSSDSSDH